MSIPSSPILDFEKAQAVYAYGRDPLDMKNYRDELERQAQAAVAPLLAKIEKWKAMAFLPLGDNHHNAALCPHCGDGLRAAEAEAQKLRESLTEVMRLCESAGVRNLANGVELGAMSWLMKMTDAIAEARKALGGSK